MGKIMFAMNLAINKVVYNLLIFLVSNFHGNRLNGLRVIAIRSWSPKILTLWNFWTDLRSLPILTRIVVESPFGDKMKVVGNFIRFSRKSKIIAFG